MVSKISKVILVVEDSQVQAMALSRFLERNGLEVLCAENGISGVAMARSHMPDLIVLDVQLPEMDGLEACRQLKADPQTADIPVIIFTAHSESENLKSGLEHGAIDFIPKDAFSEVVLLETLKQLGMLNGKDMQAVAEQPE